jgi:copper transport protein
VSSQALGGSAAAHAQLVSSSPAAGEVLAESPRELQLVFSEPADPAYAGLDLLDANGTALATGIGAPDADDPHTLVAEISPLADGVYTINWHVLSAADGHVTEGFLTFGVGEVEVPTGAADAGVGRLHLGQPPVVAALDALSRTAGYGGAMLAFGLPLIGLAVLRPALGRWPPRIELILVTLLGLAAVGAAGLIVVGSSALEGTSGPLSCALGTQTGVLLAARLAVTGLGADYTVSLSRASQQEIRRWPSRPPSAQGAGRQ